MEQQYQRLAQKYYSRGPYQFSRRESTREEPGILSLSLSRLYNFVL